MADEVKQEAQEQPIGAVPQPTTEQMLYGTFQQRLNMIITMMNDLFRDVKDIVAIKDKK